MSPKEFPNLLNYVGQDLILTDGTTLLGGDDKAAIAAVMVFAEHLLRHPELPHGRIALAFTPDEEVGGLAKDLDLDRFGAKVAYTLDGDYLGYYEDETFNASHATVVFTGRSVHTGTAKGIMINAADLAAEFVAQPERPRQLRRRADAHDFGERLQHREILLRRGLLEPGGILRARLGRREERPFEMKPQELRPAGIQRQRFAIGAHGPFIVREGGRRQGRGHRRGSVPGVPPGRFQVRFHRPVQEIVPPAAVDVQVDESGGDILPPGIDPDPFRGLGLGDDGLDPAVPDHERESGPDAFGQQEPPAGEYERHHSLTFRTSPASRATVSFQSSV
jgi:hypothetical protein